MNALSPLLASLRPLLSVWQPWILMGKRGLSCLLVALLITLLGMGSASATDFTKRDLQGRSFAGEELTGSTFVKANLRDADLSHVTALGLDLFGCSLVGANLEAANLRGVTLDMANLAGANLRGAVLEDGLMWLTQVNGADIEGADFTNVMMRSDTLKALCASASGTNPITGRDTRESLGCA